MANPSLHPDWQVVDVRHPKQAAPFVERFGEALWSSLPYEQVRDRYRELPTDKTLIVFCNAGSRSFEVQVYLDFVGLKHNLVLPGGFNVIRRIGADWLPVA
jgi:rhodanese-related sulfurtransferase